MTDSKNTQKQKNPAKLRIYGRLSFEHIFRPSSTQGSEPAYSATILIPKNDPQIAEIRKAMSYVAEQKWKTRAQGVLKNLYAAEKTNLRDGDLKTELSKTYQGYEGMMYVTARNKNQPSIFDKGCKPVQESSGLIYSGCYVNALIEFWAQDNANGKRINGSLLGVQFVKDGDRFGGGSGPAKADDFDVLEEDDSEANNPWD